MNDFLPRFLFYICITIYQSFHPYLPNVPLHSQDISISSSYWSSRASSLNFLSLHHFYAFLHMFFVTAFNAAFLFLISFLSYFSKFALFLFVRLVILLTSIFLLPFTPLQSLYIMMTLFASSLLDIPLFLFFSFHSHPMPPSFRFLSFVFLVLFSF